jgi:hypothetical protein
VFSRGTHGANASRKSGSAHVKSLKKLHRYKRYNGEPLPRPFNSLTL